MITAERVKELFIATSLYYTDDYDFDKYNGRIRKVNIKKNSSEERLYKGLANKLVSEQDTIRFFMINHYDYYFNNSKFSRVANDFWKRDSFSVIHGLNNILSSPSYHIQKALSNDEGISLKDFIKINRDTQPIPIIYRAVIAKEVNYNIVALLALGIPKLLDYWIDNSDDEYFFIPNILMLKKYIRNIKLDNKQRLEIKESIDSLR